MIFTKYDLKSRFSESGVRGNSKIFKKNNKKIFFFYIIVQFMFVLT